MFNEIVRPALILFIVCAVITGALAYVNGVTKPYIDENQKQEKAAAMIEVLPGASNFSDPITAEQLKADGYKVSEGIKNLYKAEGVGYVVEVAAKGYGGDILMMVGVSINNEVTGVKVTSHSETPGLGAKAADKGFIDQYLGPLPEGGFSAVKGAAKADGDIQAVSGATISSRAVTQGVSDAVALVLSMAGGV